MRLPNTNYTNNPRHGFFQNSGHCQVIGSSNVTNKFNKNTLGRENRIHNYSLVVPYPHVNMRMWHYQTNPSMADSRTKEVCGNIVYRND